MKCPKCKSLVVASELRNLTYTKSEHMVVTANGSFIPYHIAELEGIEGKEVWVRKEVSKEVCDSCMEEDYRGNKAHSSHKSTWSKRG